MMNENLSAGCVALAVSRRAELPASLRWSHYMVARESACRRCDRSVAIYTRFVSGCGESISRNVGIDSLSCAVARRIRSHSTLRALDGGCDD